MEWEAFQGGRINFCVFLVLGNQIFTTFQVKILKIEIKIKIKPNQNKPKVTPLGISKEKGNHDPK